MSMNVHMKNIKFTVKGKPPVSMDHLTIRGNNVRWLGCTPKAVAPREPYRLKHECRDTGICTVCPENICLVGMSHLGYKQVDKYQSLKPDRYVILPDSIPLDTLLVDDAKRLPKVTGWTSMGAGWKSCFSI